MQDHPPVSESPSSATATARALRIIGVLLLLQMVGSALVNGVLEAPLFGSPGFLIAAAPHSQQIGLAALLGLVTEGLWVAIAVTAFPLLFERERALALWLMALASVILGLAAVENAAVMSMVSLSQAYASAAVEQRERLEALRAVVASARNWPHFIARMLDGGVLFVLYAALYRRALVPRMLAGFGLLAASSMVTAVAMPLFGQAVIFPLLAPIGLANLSLAVWLLSKGARAPLAR